MRLFLSFTLLVITAGLLAQASSLADLAARHGYLWDGVTFPTPIPPYIANNGTTALDVAKCLEGTGQYHIDVEEEMYIVMYLEESHEANIVNCLFLTAAGMCVAHQHRDDLATLPTAPHEPSIQGVTFGLNIDPNAVIPPTCAPSDFQPPAACLAPRNCSQPRRPSLDSGADRSLRLSCPDARIGRRSAVPSSPCR
ncbi:hypothetical protein PANT_26d00103 [Moesziomyces antarcticus T-34]|uniref:Uncharacterized protein n=1 Tax=Pseudozyma antarctica (strain T-34) TaxID=1151754 RepID=M9M1L4_PSEA3|nr:hypothetical protein PANT_26d00103 [Moesziomyces antarcticus T-34]